MAISDKTKAVLKQISDTAVQGIVVSSAIVDLLTPFIPDAAKYPKDILEGIVTTILKNMPEYYEAGAAALGLNEHITIKIEQPGAVVTGTIHR